MQRFRALVLAVVCGVTGFAVSSEPVPLTIPGEIKVPLRGVAQSALRGFEQSRITHITFHHEGFAGTDADLFRRASAARDRQTIDQRVRNIHAYHAGQAGLGMFAYHYAVDNKGNIAKGRPVALKPSTRSTQIGTRKLADFEGHFAVVALGDFNHETLTPAGRLAFVRVMSAAQRAYRVPTAQIQPHKHHAATSCPGVHILNEADRLREMVLAHSLQAELSARGCLTGAPDGKWGRLSRRALRALIRSNPNLGDATDPSDAALFRLLDAPNATCR